MAAQSSGFCNLVFSQYTEKETNITPLYKKEIEIQTVN